MITRETLITRAINTIYNKCSELNILYPLINFKDCEKHLSEKSDEYIEKLLISSTSNILTELFSWKEGYNIWCDIYFKLKSNENGKITTDYKIEEELLKKEIYTLKVLLYRMILRHGKTLDKSQLLDEDFEKIERAKFYVTDELMVDFKTE